MSAAASSSAVETFRERTRATRYQARQQLPPNFAAVLKEYTREVLREQPQDIVAWSAQYFKRLALETDPLLAQQPPPEHYAPAVDHPELEVMSMKIAKVFATMDDGNTGTLFVHLVNRALREALGLTRTQALYILSCDYAAILDDGTMEYRPFARDCVGAVLFFQQEGFDFADSAADAAADDDAGGGAAMVHGMTREELGDELLRVLRANDAEGLGRLSFPQYRSALVNAPLQLTGRDIHLLVGEAEQTSDGFVEFKNEVRRAFELLQLSHRFAAFDHEQAKAQ